MALHVRRQGCRRVVTTVADVALERLLVVVRLHVNFQVVAEIIIH